MKFDSILKTAALCLPLSLFAGCEDAAYQSIENMVFIAEAAPADKYNQQVENLTVKGDTETSVHIRLAQPLSTDVHVTLGLDESRVKEYNDAHATGYKTLPGEYLSFAGEVTIPAGSLSSDAVAVRISEYPAGDGESFAIPLCIVSSDAPVPVARTSGRLLYLLSTPHRQVVPKMDRYTVPVSSGQWGIKTSEWTLEGWVWMSNFKRNNQAIWEAVTDNEIYIRFGDADVDLNKLQIKTSGAQFNSNRAFETERWYHIAFVTGGGKCTMYIDGAEDSSMLLSNPDYTIDGFKLCSSDGYFTADCQMAQVRFWKKALTQSAIRDAMNRPVPVDSEGLFGYWKLDEGSGSLFRDATANGFDLQCEIEPVWSEEPVDFSDPNQESQNSLR